MQHARLRKLLPRGIHRGGCYRLCVILSRYELEDALALTRARELGFGPLSFVSRFSVFSFSVFFSFFFHPYVEFKGGRLAEARKYEHTRTSVSMLRAWELQILAGERGEDALFRLRERVAERIEVTH